MIYLYVLAIVLHVASAAAWLGWSLFLPILARLISEAETSVGEMLAERGSEAVWKMDVFALLMYAFAIIAILLGPGFSGIGWTFHVALSLGLVLILVQVFLIRRSWSAFHRAVSEGTTNVVRKKLAMSVGIGHFIWIVLLVLMFLPRLLMG